VLIDHENNDEQGLQQLEPLNDTILPDQENIGKEVYDLNPL
jgi:hypothetical protein